VSIRQEESDSVRELLWFLDEADPLPPDTETAEEDEDDPVAEGTPVLEDAEEDDESSGARPRTMM